MEQTESLKEEGAFDLIDAARNGEKAMVGSSSAKLTPAQRMSMWKSFPVKIGDKVSAQVSGTYAGSSTNNGSSNTMSIYVSTIPPSAVGGGENGSGNNLPQLAIGVGIPAFQQAPNTAGIPKAYLKFQFFDKSGNFVRSWESQTTLSNTAWVSQNLSFEASQEGTLQVFVANESDVPVWYDEMEIKWDRAMIVQENHYYPFGMNMVGIEKQGTPDNRFQYNGKEKQEEFGLNAYDFGNRMYSADVPRFWQLDRFADKYYSLSPYQYTAGNPVKYVDINGDSLYVFNTKGDLTIKLPWITKASIGIIGKEDKDGNVKSIKTFSFNDLNDDRKVIEGNFETNIAILSQEDIDNYVNKSVSSRPFTAYNFQLIVNESSVEAGNDASAVLDFSWEHLDKYPSNTYFLIDGVLYNNRDAGNYMWGAAMNKIGISETFAKTMADMSSRKSGHIQNAGIPAGLPDSNGDQRAIGNGHQRQNREPDLVWFWNPSKLDPKADTQGQPKK
jgi:RHS repeat-associated protein